MSENNDSKHQIGALEAKTPAATGRPALRIVPAAAPPAVTAEAPGAPRSNLGKLMNAWADAIDRDVRLILDL